MNTINLRTRKLFALLNYVSNEKHNIQTYIDLAKNSKSSIDEIIYYEILDILCDLGYNNKGSLNDLKSLFSFFKYKDTMLSNDKEKLFELLQLIAPEENETLESWEKAAYLFNSYTSPCKLLSDTILDYVSDTDYDGPLEYEPMFYYFKDRNDTMKYNKDLLKALPSHAKKLREFHKLSHNEADDFLDLTPSESNKQYMQSFKEWKENETSQDEVVEEIMDHLLRHPKNWKIDFRNLTNKGREMLFKPLLAFFEKHIMTLPII